MKRSATLLVIGWHLAIGDQVLDYGAITGNEKEIKKIVKILKIGRLD